jgi:hypothetical protein
MMGSPKDEKGRGLVPDVQQHDEPGLSLPGPRRLSRRGSMPSQPNKIAEVDRPAIIMTRGSGTPGQGRASLGKRNRPQTAPPPPQGAMIGLKNDENDVERPRRGPIPPCGPDLNRALTRQGGC